MLSVETGALLLFLTVGAFSVLALACSAFTWRRGAPQQLFNSMEVLQQNQVELHSEYDSLEARWSAFKLDIDAQLEALERVSGQVERTRRQQAARDGAAKRNQPEVPEGDEFGLPRDPEQRVVALARLGRN